MIRLFQRHQSVSKTTRATAVFAGAGNPAFALAFNVGPSLHQGEEQRLSLGATSKIELDTHRLFKANIQPQTGWVAPEEDIAVYVLTEVKRHFVARSNIYTHLDYRVRWCTEGEQYFNTRLNDSFDKQGDVLSGHSPHPLDRNPIKVGEERFFILVNWPDNADQVKYVLMGSSYDA